MREKRLADEVIDDIKGGAHWRFNFRPVAYEQIRLESLPEVEKIVQESKVSFRGWDFPALAWNENERSRGENYIQAWASSDRRKEFWRMYQSGQFLYLSTFPEDQSMYQEQLQRVVSFELDGFKPKGFLNITNICWTQLESFSFLSRLAGKGLFDPGVIFKVSLNNIKGRVLSFAQSQRRLRRTYTFQESQMTVRKDLSSEEAIGSFRQSANDTARNILSRFGLDLAEETAESILAELWPPNRPI